ncbi:MAG: OPT oligopeptide transporter protein-domain-containing protein [Linnemannia gamsii]|nr:MAG: OPT oligopeptide transporter protein-domain-containing protein [Linnemannia gamsii]
MELRSIPKHLSAGSFPTSSHTHPRTHSPSSTSYPSYYDEKRSLEHVEQPPINLDEDASTSPIEEVRVTVSSNDDPSLPYNTFRMWFLGLLFTSIIAFVNQFFYLRQTQISIGYSVVALVSLPLGHMMAKILPTREFRIKLVPFTRIGFTFTLNPGPFSIKEHILIGTMAACNANTAYAVDIVVLQKLFYGDEQPFVAGWLLVLTTQITGFALAGAFRRFLVRPADMVWPSTLVTASLFRSLHASSTGSSSSDLENAGRMSRMKYFLLVTLGSFAFYWFPGYIFPTIGVISWVCWMSPNNAVLAQLTGSQGLGIGTISLDWSAISYNLQPLVTPWFAQLNIMLGFVFFTYLLVPWAYYTNLWDSKKYPILSPNSFQQNGSIYDVIAVLDNNGHLDEEAYRTYGPLRITGFFALTYGVGFAALTATVVHTLLYHGKEIVQRWKSAATGREDVHARLMSAYPEVPDWWYGLLFVVMVTLSFITTVKYDYMPWWALILALFIAAIFIIPVGILQAVTNQQPGLNIVTEYVIGYLLPGRAIANVTFKTYGYIVNVQALNFIADLKLGHYMKVPPQSMFLVQVISSLISCTINLGTATWLMKTQPDICTEAAYPFTCRSTKTFYSASVIWGAIGPARVFGHLDGALYSPVQLGFLIGALLPLIFWAASKQFPKSQWLKLVHWPVLFTATSHMPPALPYFYSNGLLLGFIFMFLMRRYRYRWWSRYNYLTSAAMDTGVALGGLVIFFTLELWSIKMPHWWGHPNPQNPDIHAAAIDHCALGGRPLQS